MGRLKLFLAVVNDAEAITVGYGRFAGETIVASEHKIILLGLEFERNK